MECRQVSGMWSVDSAAVYKMPPHIDTQLGREREEVEGRRRRVGEMERKGEGGGGGKEGKVVRGRVGGREREDGRDGEGGKGGKGRGGKEEEKGGMERE